MENMVDIKVVIDEKYIEPMVEVYTRNETELVGKIIYAIENVSMMNYHPVAAYDNGILKLISQRDIYCIRTEGRGVVLDTEDSSYIVKGTLTKFEEELDCERFFRISQSEIINLYKVDSFDFNLGGTVGVLFDNGRKSYVARRCVKSLRDKLNRASESSD